MWVVLLDGRAIGYVQDYPVRAYDDYAVRVQDLEAIAFDYLIGEPELVDQGRHQPHPWPPRSPAWCARPPADPAAEEASDA